MKVIHSEITLQNLSGKYVAALRLHIWSESQVIVINYVFGSYEARTATLKEVTDDARNQYIKTLNEFAGENNSGPLASRAEIAGVFVDWNLKGSDTDDLAKMLDKLFDEKEKQS